MMTACAPGNDGNPVYYVPLPAPSAPSGPVLDPSASPPTSGTSSSASAAFSPSADWAQTCESIEEFKDAFVSDVTLSRKALKRAGSMAPDPLVASDLKSLASELTVSLERFSVALVGESGKRVDSAVAAQCGAPLVAEYSLDYTPPN